MATFVVIICSDFPMDPEGKAMNLAARVPGAGAVNCDLAAPAAVRAVSGTATGQKGAAAASAAQVSNAKAAPPAVVGANETLDADCVSMDSRIYPRCGRQNCATISFSMFVWSTQITMLHPFVTNQLQTMVDRKNRRLDSATFM